MNTLQIQESMCYTVQQMLRCIHHRQWLSVCLHCKHLFLLAYYTHKAEEQELKSAMWNRPIMKIPPELGG